MRGKFLTIYGINNIGKSTHAKRLVSNLNKAGIDAVHVKYPVYSLRPTGEFLNRVLRSGDKQKISEEQLQMWFTLNRFQYEDKLEKYLSEGTWVVAEDYVGTGLAWGVTKGADMEWLVEINRPLKDEDYAMMLEGKRSMKAKEDGHLHESNDDLAQRCQQVHRELAEKFGWDVVQIQPLPDDTEALVWSRIKKRFGI